MAASIRLSKGVVGRSALDGVCPARGNGCVIHAFKAWCLAVPAAWDLDGFPRESAYPVLGTVALWGRVVEHERGFRAEHAIVRQVWVPERIVVTVRLREEWCRYLRSLFLLA